MFYRIFKKIMPVLAVTVPLWCSTTLADDQINEQLITRIKEKISFSEKAGYHVPTEETIIEHIKPLLSQGADINYQEENIAVPRTYSSFIQYLGYIEWLMSKTCMWIDYISFGDGSECTPSQKTNEPSSAWTALMYASYKGLPDVVSFLLKQGANPDFTGAQGWNAYTLAEYYRDRYEQSNDESQKEHANKYNRIVCELEPLTTNTAMPPSLYIGKTQARCKP
ncbi:ankyrin repeat domain-containing protein [Endozoicomonas gorgoniicola]|uniref:Ankyrin repeat domain-containing protein n=1 Tax=Endozoicomonas gorgoniicola TaxID=1234144 RepID=A0ABT3N2Y3_9GAMM|nr:ankyrin repeat domain-containing protein [Endozoicomonas gorgoniicola]MCW7555993.1 ankyrin repeat domain-containing protein [Endozoicomonas gorgoniicola]